LKAWADIQPLLLPLQELYLKTAILDR